MSKLENPIGSLFPQIKRILDYIVVKNSREADRYETPTMAREASLYALAVSERDDYLLYTDRFTPQMFLDVNPILKRDIISLWLETPRNIPLVYRDHLTEVCRQLVIDEYEEKNDYYRMLAGLPPLSTPETDYIRVPESIRQSIRASQTIPDLPIHELSQGDQDLVVADPWFERLLVDRPDLTYLNYLGRRSIDPMVARSARDFQLIRYIPIEGFSDLNPYLLKDFANLYNSYRDYVVFTLYNREMENNFTGYRPFMGLLIVLFVVNQLCSKSIEHSTDFRFLDDKVIATIFQMYGIPRDIIVTMTSEVQRTLVTSILKLIRKKATNEVFYDLIKILGFDEVTIHKLMLMKQQAFTEDGQAVFSDGSKIVSFDDLDRVLKLDRLTGKPEKELGLAGALPGDDWERERNPEFNAELATRAIEEGKVYGEPEYLDDVNPYRGLPYFQAVDLKEKNPYRSIIKAEGPTLDYFQVTDPDPRWWDTQETRDTIRNKNYTVADSKYLMIESIIRETDYMYEVVLFMRLILDLKRYTDQITVPIPELFGTERQSLFDLMVFLLAGMCFNAGLDGTILTSASGLLAIAGFNFELDLEEFQRYLRSTEYVDQEKVMEFMNWVAPRPDSATLKFIFEEIIGPFRDWLTEMMMTSPTRQGYLEYEAIFKATFSYDIAGQIFNREFEGLDSRLMTKYDLTRRELEALKLFYPHRSDDQAVTVEDFANSGYAPFLGVGTGQSKTWYVETGLGNLYMFDILASDDIRYVTDDTGDRQPNPVLWDPVAGQFDQRAIETVIRSLEQLNGNQLANAYFKVDTLIPGTKEYYPGITFDDYGEIKTITYLPSVIRAENVFKDIMIDRFRLAMAGEAEPPGNYREYLRRKAPQLEALFEIAKGSKTDWLNTMMIVAQAVELELNLRLKIWEQTVVGQEMYFKSLITLIKYFKSYMVDFTRSSLKYIFDSKIDPGGGSNMLKLFDEIFSIGWHILVRDEFGLYDTENDAHHHWLIRDRATMIVTPQGQVDGAEKIDGSIETVWPVPTVEKRESWHGSLRLVDEVIFRVNGRDEDPRERKPTDTRLNFWLSGEADVGRFDMDHDRLDAGPTGPNPVEQARVDTEGWKEFVESYNYGDDTSESERGSE